jgi:hypothetical protein
MSARVPALVVVAAALLAAGAGSRAVAAEPHRGDRGPRRAQAPQPRRWRVPVGVGVSLAVPAGSVSRELALGDAFGSGPTVRIDAGVAYRAIGASFVGRRGFVSPGREWCPVGASCTARFDAVGGALTFSPGWDEGFSPLLMAGAAVDEGEVRYGGRFHRLSGQELFASLFMGPRLGGATSPWRVGGYLDLRVMRLDRVATPESRAVIPASSRGTPMWFELGIRAAFD